jgi:outer membrane protein assembly factor BamB
MTRIHLSIIAAALGLGADWPQFRGPGAAGVADGASPPVKWAAAEGVRWSAPLPGKGLSGPVVQGGRVYVTACSGPRQDRLHVLAFDLASGKPLWERELAATGGTMCHDKSNMAAPTPVADATGVYALFATGDVAAFDRDGNLRWYRSLVGDYPGVVNNLGLAASPVLYRDVLIVPMDSAGSESFLAGLEVKDGRNRWKVPRPSSVNWVTPVLVTRGPQTELFIQSGGERAGYDPLTGQELWKDKEGGSSMPSPVADGGRVVTFASGLVSLEQRSAHAPPAVAWQAKNLSTQYCTPLVYKGRVYTINRAGALACTDAETGKPVWKDPPRLKGPFWASPVAADGRLYAVNGEGLTTVVQLGDTPKVLATNAVGKAGEEFQANPAVADGVILLRSHGRLICVGGPPPKQS